LSDGKMCFDMKLSCFVIAGLVFLLFSHCCCAQQSTDTSIYHESVSRLQQVYLKGIEDNAEIYHGSEYIRNGRQANGFPFFESDNLLAGSVSYQGIIYTSQNLQYDIVTDELIIPNYTKNALIVLSPRKVDSFSINAHVFVNLESNASNQLPVDGYYEQLYSGEPAVYVKRVKKLASGTGSEEAKYIQYNNFFVRLKNVYYPIDGKSSLLEVLKDENDALRKYIRANKLNFKKNPESALVLSATYYSQLKH